MVHDCIRQTRMIQALTARQIFNYFKVFDLTGSFMQVIDDTVYMIILSVIDIMLRLKDNAIECTGPVVERLTADREVPGSNHTLT